MVLDFAKEAIQNTATHSINFDELRAGKASIKVVGCGGCGGNMTTWLFNKGINGATIYSVNTDALHLSVTKADEKVLLGKELTRGLGAGGMPNKGREAAKEAIVELKKAVGNSDMVFVLAGLGGGTGTGSAPVVAQLAKERIEEIQIPINIFYSDLTPIEQEILLLKKKLNEIIRILNG